MRITGLILILISIITVFFNYNIAIFILGMAMFFLGIYYLQSRNKNMSYIYFVSSLIFIVGICIKGF
ncbi:hypothetical protein CWR45_12615 [Oceanobacillus chungangensis]|uniref:DUF3953 domain-containing protein n=1 Tax=Oceanobacillus chungangensis TaxID=1229152 RepID=A0A3D8PNI7_9BACI|nr:hypothetical protein CWR45_12615 [Oceanobacillus chungangensis]